MVSGPRLALGWIFVLILMVPLRAVAETGEDWWKTHLRPALLAYDLGEWEQAEMLFMEALEAAWEIGRFSEEYAAVYSNLGNLYRQTGDFARAEHMHQNALSIDQRRLGEDHPDTARHWSRLGFALYQQGKTERAERAFSSALFILKESEFALSEPAYGAAVEVAGYYEEIGEKELAAVARKLAHRIALNVFGPWDPRTKNAAEDL